MIRTLPASKIYRAGFIIFILLYFLFLFAPLLVTCVLAFNDSMFPSLPWKGFTLDWFFGTGGSGKTGIFHDTLNLRSMFVSLRVAVCVSILSTSAGICAAFLFEQENFRFKKLLYFFMIAPLVIPGVILGISILLFTNRIGLFFEEKMDLDVKFLRPGFWLVVFGQSSFISTFVALVVIARLKKFDRTLEDAAYNLGGGRFRVIWHITLKYLRPSIIGAAAVSFLMSLENFNTTLFLVGSETTLPINLYLQVRDGSTPVINAISFLLILCTSVFAVINLCVSGRKAVTVPAIPPAKAAGTGPNNQKIFTTTIKAPPYKRLQGRQPQR
jgi:spermidine/putrescine transport system permease protein